LADAITYAIREGVDELIDIATLTGAVVSALGRVAAGIMGSDQTLVDNVIASGKICGEQFWQLPLFVEYKEGLKSDIADLKNAGSRGEAGSSSAAMFLKEFTEGNPRLTSILWGWVG
jgi:leucyl aminopeptidase